MSTKLYLHPSGRSQNWYVRLTVPKALQHLTPQKEYRTSTGTADRNKAKKVAARIEAEKRQEWEDLAHIDLLGNNQSCPTSLSSSLIQEICGIRLSSWIKHDESERFGDDGIDDALLEEINQFCQYTEAAMRSVLAQGKAGRSWEEALDMVLDWCDSLGYQIDLNDPLFPKLIQNFAAVEKQAQEVILSRNQGQQVAFPKVEASCMMMSELTQEYEQSIAARINRKTVTTNCSIWQKFIDFKKDVPLDSIASADIYNFLEYRLHVTIKPWSQKYATGYAKNVLKDIFAFARTKNLMSAPNPVLTLEKVPKISRKEEDARLKPRFPLASTQLNQLFASDWYKKSAKHWTGKMKSDLAARYWCPLICAFHGSRVREVVQLMSGDFSIVSNVLLMAIQIEIEDEDQVDVLPERRVKNAFTKRTIPVHPTLVSLGFKDFVGEMQKAFPLGMPLFPSAIPKSGGKSPLWGRSYEQAFLRHVRDRLGFGSGYGNHSFRHLFEDKIRDAQLKNGAWPAGLAQFFSGRQVPRDADKDFFRDEGSASLYGKGFKPENTLDYIQQIQFEDVIFPPHFKQWKLAQ